MSSRGWRMLTPAIIGSWDSCTETHRNFCLPLSTQVNWKQAPHGFSCGFFWWMWWSCLLALLVWEVNGGGSPVTKCVGDWVGLSTAPLQANSDPNSHSARDHSLVTLCSVRGRHSLLLNVGHGAATALSIRSVSSMALYRCGCLRHCLHCCSCCHQAKLRQCSRAVESS